MARKKDWRAATDYATGSTFCTKFVNIADLRYPSRLCRTKGMNKLAPRLSRNDIRTQIHWRDSRFGNIFSIYAVFRVTRYFLYQRFCHRVWNTSVARQLWCPIASVTVEDKNIKITRSCFTNAQGAFRVNATDRFHARALVWKEAPGNHSGIYFTAESCA